MRSSGFRRSLALLGIAAVLLEGCAGNEYCSTPAGATCSAATEEACAQKAGCHWRDACVSRECRELTAEAACTSAPYCMWFGDDAAAGSGSCRATGGGTTDCGYFDPRAACEAKPYCAYRPTCSGEVASCEGRSESICNAVPYSHCVWVKEPSPAQLY